MSLPEFSLKRPVTIIVIIIILTMLGTIAAIKLPLQLFPDMSFPNLYIFAPYPSSSPEEINQKITKPLEDALSTINGVKSVKSTSSSSTSSVRIEFETGKNMDIASLEIRDKIDSIRNELPSDLKKIYIRRWETSNIPTIRFSISGDIDKEKLIKLAEKVIKPRLERIDGVANLDIRGVNDKKIYLYVSQGTLDEMNLRIYDLLQTVLSSNLSMSEGYIEEDGRKWTVRIPSQIENIEQLKNLPIAEGKLKLKDVAKIKYDFPPVEDYYILNGRNALSFVLYKTDLANVVEISRKVKKELKKIIKMPEYKGLNLLIYRDQSKDILASLKALIKAGIIGSILAIIILFLFLQRFRVTLIIALSIPLSVIFAFAFMFLLNEIFRTNISINIISLSGLMMAVGMLVDNGVVVLENIFRYRQDFGYSPEDAARVGSSEVARAIFGSTLTTVIVFSSITFMGGSSFGRWLSDFGLSITLALFSSFLVALSFNPIMAARLMKGEEKPRRKFIIKLEDYYKKFISFALKWKYFVALAAIIVFAISIYLYKNIPKEFMPHSRERQASYTVLMPGKMSLDEMKTLFNKIEKTIIKNKDKLEIANYTFNYGIGRLRRGRYYGSISLYLKDEKDSKLSTSEIETNFFKLLPQEAGVNYTKGRRRFRGGFGGGVTINLTGPDYQTLIDLADKVKKELEKSSDISDVTTNIEGGEREVKVNVKKDRSFAVSSQRVSQTISSALSERPITRYRWDDKEVDVIFQVDKGKNFTLGKLKNLTVDSPSGSLPIYALTKFKIGKGAVSIIKENKRAIFTIEANTDKKGMYNIMGEVKRIMNNIKMPPGYSWNLGEDWKRFRESEQTTGLSLLLGVFLIYVVMASLFESFMQPFVILITVPLALFGVAITFSFAGISFNNASSLGILILMGIVVNNGIILLDHINILRRKGKELNDAIIQAGRDRLRPILMTAITTIFGLLPMSITLLLPGVFGPPEGRAAMWSSISLAVLGGLTTSTFLTLTFLPSFYLIFENWKTVFRKFFGRKNK
jgi:HAE1 family hydrophobic/amphiphilic exporter-1